MSIFNDIKTFVSFRSYLKQSSDLYGSNNIMTKMFDYFKQRWSYPVRRGTYEWIDSYMKSARMDDIHLIARDVASTNFKLYKKKDWMENEYRAKPITEHECYDLMETPNPSREFDHYVLFYLTEVYLNLACGEAFWLLERAGNHIKEIYLVPPHWVTFTPTVRNNYFQVLPLGNISAKAINVEPEDMFWFKEPDPLNPYARGRGRGENVGDEIEADEYAAKYQKKFFYNDAMPPFLVSVVGAQRAEIDRLKQDWMNRYSGYMNARMPGFAPFDLKMQKLADTNREMDMINSRRYLRDSISQHWMIPPEIKGILENSNRATIDASYFLFSKNVVLPRLQRWESMLNKQFIKPYYGSDLILKFDNIVPEDKDYELRKEQQEASIALSALQAGAITVNQYLERTNQPTQADGDVYLRSSIVQPIKLGNGDIPVEPTIMPAFKKLKSIKRTPEQRKMLWLLFDKAARSQEKDFKLIVNKYAKAESKKFMAALVENDIEELSAKSTSLTISQLKAALDKVFIDSENQELFRLFYPAWFEAMKIGGQLAANQLGIQANFDLYNPDFERLINEIGMDRVKEINRVTKEQLRQAGIQGIEAGESMKDIAKRLTEVFSELEDTRALKIARTETMMSVNSAQVDVYKVEGVEKKEWLATMDDRTRDAHLMADGQVVGINDAFVVDGENLMYPGDPNGSAENVISCRCTVAPIVE